MGAEKMESLVRTLVLVGLIAGSAVTISACTEKDGPFEQAGESIDEAGESIEESAEEIRDEVDDAF